MRIETEAEVDLWVKPGRPGDPVEPGYEEWLAAEIAEGEAELDAGKHVTLEQVKREFGLE